VVDEIRSVGPAQGPEQGKPVSPSRRPKEGERSFKEILQDSIQQVNQLQKDADLSVEKLYRGEANVDEVMVAFKKAQLAFEALMQIRNKLIDAYEEINQMRI